MSRFENILQRKLEKFADYARLQIGGRAVSKYMRNSGAKTPEAQKELGRNRRTGAGSLRIVSGRLSRSLTGGRTVLSGNNPEGILQIKQSGTKTEINYGTKVPYARAHEYGFSGTVQIPSHTRRITQAFGRSIEPTTVNVSAHSRTMDIPERPYLSPALKDTKNKLKNRAQDLAKEAVEEWLTQ